MSRLMREQVSIATEEGAIALSRSWRIDTGIRDFMEYGKCADQTPISQSGSLF